ncbi:c-type cytochrome [Sulfuricella sp.]|uniref:c-type cytochrome n=1 Tax=Sulfuricella sp. TaxID=2099377 RepID=UPI002C06EE37|nr:rhodanese-like domain-containing protein [Sulfuricella sp.]HUX62308.1 rhodanese-like domain-containing protein [Sulfuricella sp.]
MNKYTLATLAAIMLPASVWAADAPSSTASKAVMAMKSASSHAESLTPVENLALGTALLLANERDAFEMQQVFRLALYLRPLRRLYDPNPALVRTGEDPNVEKVYMDRIKNTLKPELIARIDAMNLTWKDMEKYLEKHGALFGVDWRKTPTFALLEYAVNDYHEQIAPPNTIAAKDKPAYFIADSVKSISGKNPGDGKKLFEGVCSACHGMDGQGRFPPIVMKSYLSLHSDHEHFEIVKGGPPQKPGAPVVMPTFEDKLSKDQIWSIVKYLRTWEKVWADPKNVRRGEAETKAAGVKFYSTPELLGIWKAKNPNVVILDLQSDIAYRIMGHIPDSKHIRPEEFDGKMKTLPKDKEIIVIDMFGSQGLAPAATLARAGYKTSYLSDGMMDWHIARGYQTDY